MKKESSERTMKSVKKRDLLVSYETIFNRDFNTKAQRDKFKQKLHVFAEECQKEIVKEFGAEVRKARRRTGLTQAQLAELINTSRTAITRVEKGDQNISIAYIAKVALALGAPFEIRIGNHIEK